MKLQEEKLGSNENGVSGIHEAYKAPKRNMWNKATGGGMNK